MLKKIIFITILLFLPLGSLIAMQDQELTADNSQSPKTPLEILKEKPDLIKLSSPEAAKKLIEEKPQIIDYSRVIWIEEKPYYNFMGIQELDTVDDIKIKLKTISNVSAETGEISEVLNQFIIEKDEQKIAEPINELIMLDRGKNLINLYNILPENKEKIRDKMMINYIDPLINFAVINEIRKPSKQIIKKIHKVLIQKQKNCDSSFVINNKILSEIPDQDFDLKIIKTNSRAMSEIWDDECIIKSADEENMEKLLAKLNKSELLEKAKLGFKESKTTFYLDQVKNTFWEIIFRVQNLFR